MGGPGQQNEETFYDANTVLGDDGEGSSTGRSRQQVGGEAAGEHVSIEIVGLIANSIEKRVESSSSLSGSTRAWGRCCIYRVHEKFHKMGERSAYMPEVVSIGPLHYKKESLKAMEECKLLYMHTLLSRTAQKKFKLEDHHVNDDQKIGEDQVVLQIQKKRKIEELDRNHSSEVQVTTVPSMSLTKLGEIEEVLEERDESNIRPGSTSADAAAAAKGTATTTAASCIKLESSEAKTTQGGWLTILKECVAAIKKIESTARECYSDPALELIKSEEFVEIMVVDGLFIIELFQRCATKHRKARNDPLFGKLWVLSSLTRDLLLLENQIPMRVLKCLFDLTTLEDELQGKSLNRLVLGFFDHLMPRNEGVLDEMQSKCEGANHLLDLLAKTFHPPRPITKAHSSWKVLQSVTKLKHTIANKFTGDYLSSQSFMQGMTTKLKHAGLPKVLERLSSTSTSAHLPLTKEKKIHLSSWKFIPTVTELRRAGVKFKKGSTGGSFLDIKFDGKDGVLRIPPILIQDKTDLLFRNLIASEQFSDGRVTYMTSYAFFMDSLINSSHDVELLRKKGIITTYLGSDEDVSDLFNKLCCELIIGKSYYSPLCDRLNKYCEQRWHRWQATLNRDYCNSPCAIISIFAAFLLIILTLGATSFAVLSFFIHKS